MKQLPFSREFERIMGGLVLPINLVCLDGVWGGIFGYQGGSLFWKLARCLPCPVAVGFKKPLLATATASEVRTAIHELSTDAWPQRRRTMKTLQRAFIQRARRCPFRKAWADVREPRLSALKPLLQRLQAGIARFFSPHISQPERSAKRMSSADQEARGLPETLPE